MTQLHDVVIIGGGISGIGSVIALREAGIDDVLVLERSAELGGTWRDNTYPGCACDVPSALYQWSYAQKPDWHRVFAERAEIQQYVLDVAAEHGVGDVVETGVEVLDAAWDNESCEWHVSTSAGERRGRSLIIAAGPLHEPVLPDGVHESAFAGPTFHSSHWDHDVDLDGKRVAIIGTGASCVQFLPHVQKRASSVVVLQRTPGWVVPKPDRKIGSRERALYRRLPIIQRVLRQVYWVTFDTFLWAAHYPPLTRFASMLGKWNIRRAIKDRRLRKLVTPDYAFGCKRAMLSNSYYPALAADNVELVPHALADVKPNSIVAADGSEHEIDVLIYGTGFHVSDLPIAARVRGSDGRTMEEVWGDAPRALYGTSVAGFPNAFMIFGPNIGTISAFVMLESQLSFITSALTQARAAGYTAIDVKPETVERYKAEVNRRLEGSVFTSGCHSYYQDSAGGIYSVWPGTMRELTRRLKRCELADFEVMAPVTTGEAGAPVAETETLGQH